MTTDDVEYRVRTEDDGTITVEAVTAPPAGQQFLLTPDRYGTYDLTPYTEPETEESDHAKYRMEREGDLYRIYATRDINGGVISAGEKGGLIESEQNLAQNGNCWVYRGAKVVGNSRVASNALIYDEAEVSGGLVRGHARVCGEAKMFAGTIDDCAVLTGGALMYGGVLSEGASLTGDAQFHDGYLGGTFKADSGRFGKFRESFRDGPSLVYGNICNFEQDGWEVAVDDSTHLLAVSTRYGALTLFRTAEVYVNGDRSGNYGYGLSVGCQQPTFATLREVAERAGSYQVEIDAINGFLAMARVYAASWGVKNLDD